jgi:uncharacterized protein (TIGR03118 family)
MNIKSLLYRKSNVSAAILALISTAAFAQTPANNVYVQHNLVSDVAGQADNVDPNLVNPWGLTQSATSPFWASNHDKGNTTLYNGTGVAATLVVVIPAAGSTSTPGTPTGQIAGNGASWKLANGGAASFIFATEDGTISAWNGTVAPAGFAQILVDNSKTGAVYKGLTSNPSTTTPMLYAANFNSGKIDVFDGTFAPVTTTGGFTDPNLPAGFAPFNIWNIGGKLYVTYAKQDAAKKNDVSGAGNGVVNVFDLNGNLLQRITANGPLNSPWGVNIAPANWGAFGGALLVGNFGDGKINAFDLKTGNALGTLQDATGKAIAIQGLWALLFGNGRTADANTLYFTAGPSFGDNKNHGLYGGIAPPMQVTGINNAASQASGPIAPGEIVELNGFTIGPSPLLASAVPTTGTLGTTVGTAATGITSVTFNGTAAPILYASASATSVIVPYELSGSTTANVVVTFKNNTSASFSTPVAATAPGLFTLNQTGSGAVVAYNSDGTLNSATNAALAGTPVLLFATGEGQTNPPGTNGAITTGSFFHAPVATVSLSVNSKPAPVIYSLSAPGLVAGVMMVEAIIPPNPPGVTSVTGPVPIVLTVGSASSPAGTTIFTR